MRIEEVSQGNHVKIPSKLESELIKVMNRFFISNAKELENSREGIILEVQKRIRPMVANMVKRIAWLEGQKIFEEQLRTVLEEEIADIVAELTEKVLSLRTELIVHENLEFPITTPTAVIVLPSRKVMNIDYDILKVYVNGMKQTLGEGYELVINTNNTIKEVRFSEVIEIGDNVTLECWTYSETLR